MAKLAHRAALAAAAALALAGAASAQAATATTTRSTASTSSETPIPEPASTTPPPAHRLSSDQALAIADRLAKMRKVRREYPGSFGDAYLKGAAQWQVSYFDKTGKKEIGLVVIDDLDGRVVEQWTGFQIAWTMARGYPGAFGRHVNALYVWLPLCALFFVPFFNFRRPFSLLHLDLLALLSFSVSLAFFNHADVYASVPLAYPPLLYLLARMLWIALRRPASERAPAALAGEPFAASRSPGAARRARRGPPRLRLLVPAPWLALGVVFLLGFRIALNVTDSNVIDVGYAGVIGAHKLVDGQKLYEGWPADNRYGDTYGPVTYFAYVPAYAVFGWSGTWDDLPAAHAAAILFDLLALIGLFLLGRRVRGPTLGLVLAYAWAAFPFTLFVLCSNSNDALVSALIVGALLLVTSAPARGVLGALAGLTKFAPLALGPLLLRGVGASWPRARSAIAYVGAYAITGGVVMLPVLLDANTAAFWHDTIAYQARRSAPFSIWGLWGGLSFEQHMVQGAAAALACAVAFVPRGRRTLIEVAALGAAVLIAVQLGLTYWFYLYIVWFFPLVALAAFGAYPSILGADEARELSTHTPGSASPAESPGQWSTFVA